MAARLMNGLLSALHRGWHQGYDALHPAPQPTLLEALRDTCLAARSILSVVIRPKRRTSLPPLESQLLIL
jgi:hypothetical protein